MTQYTIAIGDWSGDGHEKYDNKIVEIPIAYTTEQLGANFAENVRQFGWGPHSFANEYENSRIPKQYVDALRAHDFDVSVIEHEDDDPDTYWVDTDALLKIVMFFFGHGLSGFEWSEVIREEPPALIGWWSRVTAGIDSDTSQYGVSVGYGLYY